jgi:hypothetical protein
MKKLVLSSNIVKIAANPRDIGNIWRPRTQEFTGGYNSREMGNYGDLDVNPNENADGLAHHTRGTTEDSESNEQRDKEKRRHKALIELVPGLKHIDIRPEKMDEMMERSPMMEQENTLLETGLGVDLGANGLSLSAGANVGSVRSDTANVTYGHPSRGRIRASKEEDISDVFDVLKTRRKYKGRKYEEDEESEEEEKKSKAKKKRKKKRSGKKGRKKAGGKLDTTGGREIKSKTKRRKATVQLQLDAPARRQSFAPNVKSIAIRQQGATRSEGIPLRLRDPVAYQRKLANEKMRRQGGSLPRAMTHHRSSGATGIAETATRGGYIGGTKGSTKMPSASGMGTNMRSGMKRDRVARGWVGDPLGLSDPIPAMKLASEIVIQSDVILKAKSPLSRAEIISLKKKLERVLRKLEGLVKSSPVIDEHSKKGGQASENVSTAPSGGTTLNDELKPGYNFDDTTLVFGIVGKR